MKNLRIENKKIKFSLCTYDEMDKELSKERFHPYYFLIYILEGEIIYFIEFNEYHLKKGDILLVCYEKYHYVKKILKYPFKRIIFEFTPTYYAQNKLADNIFTNRLHFPLPDNSPVPMIFNFILDSYGKCSPLDFDVLCKNQLQLIVVFLYQLKDEHIQAKVALSKTCKDILEYINNYITHINNIDYISKKLFFSKSYISHIFKKEMNISIMQYINNKKMSLADNLLKKGKSPTEVAKYLGYKNYITFYRIYRETYKRAPSNSNLSIEDNEKK